MLDNLSSETVPVPNVLTNVDVGSATPIDELGFEFFPTDTAKVPTTTEREIFREYEYEVSGLNFDQYQIKVVFVSPNQAYAPIIKDLRAIALAV